MGRVRSRGRAPDARTAAFLPHQRRGVGALRVRLPQAAAYPFSRLRVGICLHSPSIKSAPNQAFFVIPRNNRHSYVESLNLTYQRELGYDISFDIAYVATFGRKLQYNQQFNAAPPGAVVPNAPVTVTEIQTGISRKAADRENGSALHLLPSWFRWG